MQTRRRARQLLVQEIQRDAIAWVHPANGGCTLSTRKVNLLQLVRLNFALGAKRCHRLLGREAITRHLYVETAQGCRIHMDIRSEARFCTTSSPIRSAR